MRVRSICSFFSRSHDKTTNTHAQAVNYDLSLQSSHSHIDAGAQGFDRQNAAGALISNSIYVPPNDFSLSPVNPVSVQISGPSTVFTLNVPASGTFSGPVSFTASAPTGVTVAFLNNPLTVPTAAATTVQVSASTAATAGFWTITITGSDSTGTLTHVLNVQVWVSGAQSAQPPPSPNSFSLSSTTTAVIVQQAGNSISLTLNIGTTGSFSGTVALTYIAPNGVTLALPTMLSVSGSTSTTVLVAASAVPVAPALGLLVQLTSADGPSFGDWPDKHPVTANSWGTVSGGVTFKEVSVAYSASFPQTYLALHQGL